MTRYTTSVNDVTAEQLEGFFVDWPNPPTPETHLRLLHGSDHVVLAIDDEANRVVGFITAITDGVLSAYIPLLEVLPDYQSRGIGGELVRRMLDDLRELYMIDLMCDDDLTGWYTRFGLMRAGGMVARNYDRQNGAPAGD